MEQNYPGFLARLSRLPFLALAHSITSEQLSHLQSEDNKGVDLIRVVLGTGSLSPAWHVTSARGLVTVVAFTFDHRAEKFSRSPCVHSKIL